MHYSFLHLKFLSPTNRRTSCFHTTSETLAAPIVEPHIGCPLATKPFTLCLFLCIYINCCLYDVIDTYRGIALIPLSFLFFSSLQGVSSSKKSLLSITEQTIPPGTLPNDDDVIVPFLSYTYSVGALMPPLVSQAPFQLHLCHLNQRRKTL